MSLYKNLDGPTGNNKPKYANTKSVYGVSATEAANTLGDGKKVAHAGWVQQSIGTGPIKTLTITSGGAGYNASGFLTISGGGDGTVNVAYTIANSRNTMQGYSTNAWWNVITSLTINSPGAGFNVAPTIIAGGSNITPATFAVTLGGRAGRRFYETLVASGSITGDDTGDNTYFPGA